MALCTHLGLGLIMTPLSWRPSPVKEAEFITSLTAQKRYNFSFALFCMGDFEFPLAVLGFVMCCVVLCCVTMYVCCVVSCYVFLCCVDLCCVLFCLSECLELMQNWYCLPYRFQSHLQTVLEVC